MYLKSFSNLFFFHNHINFEGGFIKTNKRNQKLCSNESQSKCHALESFWIKQCHNFPPPFPLPPYIFWQVFSIGIWSLKTFCVWGQTLWKLLILVWLENLGLNHHTQTMFLQGGKWHKHNLNLSFSYTSTSEFGLLFLSISIGIEHLKSCWDLLFIVLLLIYGQLAASWLNCTH